MDKKQIGCIAALLLGMLVCAGVSATPVTMHFDSLTPGSHVHTYYDGGCSTKLGVFGSYCVDHGGPDDGVVWKNATVKDLGDAASNPNYVGIGLLDMAFGNNTITMNVADGFDTGFSFAYTTTFNFTSGAATIYDGLDGTGSQLATLDLAGTGIYCNESIPCWHTIGVNLAGTARSVVFDGSGSGDLLFGLDNVTLGAHVNHVPVPEPAQLGMFGIGLLLIGGVVALRRRHAPTV